MVSPLVLAVLTAVVAEAISADAVTGDTSVDIDGDDGVFFPFFFLFVVVCGAIFRGAPRFRFFNHPGKTGRTG